MGALIIAATTRIVGGYCLHIGRIRAGRLIVGQTVTATVKDERQRTQALFDEAMRFLCRLRPARISARALAIAA